MIKRIFVLLLSLLMLVNLGFPVIADEVEPSEIRRIRIVNPKNLERLAENCRLDSYSRNLVVSLEADLDLEGSDFSGIPIFCGKFEGNGHTIRGLNLNREGSVQGFFRYLTDSAEVENLHLQGEVQPAGTAAMVGGFAGENRGLIHGCSFTGSVSGKEHVGGIVGENTVTGRIEDCFLNGSVFGGHFVGGIAGTNLGTIRGCENYAAVNETSGKNQVELSDITLDTLVHSEAANTVTDVGGIAGKSTGVIRDCSNHASVGYTSMGYNIGGIAGTQSGSLLNCQNNGTILGRKEVGGIVGQMEPSSVMEFQEDVLQILERQLNSVEKAIHVAGSNLEGAGADVLDEIEDMYGHIQNAQNAVTSLIPHPEDLDFPDLDTIQAARNSIGDSLVGMSDAMEDAYATAYSALGRVSSNLSSINSQLNAVRTTLKNISDTTGGSVVDSSDEDSEEDLTGKVADCRNFGRVQADLNCGGIAGAIAMENDLDVKEDWKIKGENTLKFESEIRAVIRDCENSGIVAAKNQNVGGIVGFQSLGLVKNSTNSGKVDAQNADYVGGIAGLSMGFIRNAYANGEIFGRTYVGGIAGAATIATDCRTLIRIGSGVEKLGAILGSREEPLKEVEDPVAGNYYLSLRENIGAIDGISYDGQAQSLQNAEFFRLEDIPEIFRRVSVTFRYNNDTERKFFVDFGAPFPEEWIPPIPPKDERRSYWEGMEEADLSCVLFDLVFDQAYTNQITVLESSVMRDEIPVLLLQGVFSETASFAVEALDTKTSLEDQDTPVEAWSFLATEPEHQTQIRLLLPDDLDAERIRILIRGEDQTWREEAHHVLGRYVVSPVHAGDDAIAVVQAQSISWSLILALASITVLAGLLFCWKQKKKQ